MSEASLTLASDLVEKVHGILLEHPGGLTEYELLERFGATGWADALDMFRAHFLLFNALYRLRSRLEAAGEGTVRIHCLRIALAPRDAAAQGAVDAVDPLAAYYLDGANLEGTRAEDVQRLLDSFWRRLTKGDAREKALEVLGLSDPVDRDTIKRRYRALAKEHHPDRGGRDRDLAALNAAMEILR